MSKIKTLIVVLLAAIILFLGVGATTTVFADTAGESQAETVNPDISPDESSLEELAVQFTEYLKQKYGEEYDYYYNRIIEQWGSVEAYLLSLDEKMPQEYQSDWQKFISWLGDYSVIWAPALAVVIVILVAIIGKKQFNKIVERAVNGRLSPIINELNMQSNATVAILRAQKALMGANERFAEPVKELTAAEKELKDE